MYKLYVLLFNIWLILAAESTSDKDDIDNHKSLILTEFLGTFYYPIQGRINSKQEQEFYYSKAKDGSYYCPIENTEKNKELKHYIEKLNKEEFRYCLFKKKFKDEEDKLCKDEVKPLIVKEKDIFGNPGHVRCGTGYMYKFVYEVCVKKTKLMTLKRLVTFRKTPKGELFSDVRHPHLYKICYDGGENRVLYIKHRIMWPAILDNFNMYRERKSYSFDNANTAIYGIEAFEALQYMYKAYASQGNTIHYQEPQKLVPEKDFALHHWIKSTNHVINYSPMHYSFKFMWDNINIHVTNKLITNYKKLGEVEIYTGTSGVFKEGEDNKIVYVGDPKYKITIPELWWKLVYAKDLRQVTIIIMHNTPFKEDQRICQGSVCNMAKWGPHIDRKLLPFAYCCKMSDAVKIPAVLQLKVLGTDAVVDFD